MEDGSEMMLHANGHTMSVAREPLALPLSALAGSMDSRRLPPGKPALIRIHTRIGSAPVHSYMKATKLGV